MRVGRRREPIGWSCAHPVRAFPDIRNRGEMLERRQRPMADASDRAGGPTLSDHAGKHVWRAYCGRCLLRGRFRMARASNPTPTPIDAQANGQAISSKA